VAVLDEVIYGMDAKGEVPVSVTVRRACDGGVNLLLPLTDIDAVEIVGAAPKAASFHELRCAADSSGRWSCSVTVDV
jgi:protein archease